MNMILVHPPCGCDRWVLRINWLPEGIRRVGDHYYLLSRHLTEHEKKMIKIVDLKRPLTQEEMNLVY